MKIQTSLLGEKGRAVFNASLTVLGMVLLSSHGNAQDVTLQAGGSTATVNLGGGTGNIGMDDWSVYSSEIHGMQNQLNQQWFWYSVNGGTTVQSIDNLGGLSWSTNTADSSLTASYQNNTLGLAVLITYNLTGSGANSGAADLTEAIEILNLNQTSAINNFQFYQYSNFNLLQNNLNTIGIGGGPGAYTSIFQSTSAGANGIEETIDSPYANGAEAGPATGTGAVLNDVTSGSGLNGTTYYGPGDVAWAFEWSTNIAADGEFDITKDKNLSIEIVPEPTTMALIALGFGAFGLMARRVFGRNV